MLSNKGAERAVLAGLCQHGFDCYIEVVDILSIDCFLDPKNQLLFRVIENIFSKDQRTIDIPSINSEAQSYGVYDRICKDQIDQEYIRSLFNYPIDFPNVRHQSQVLVKLKIGRKAQEAHQKAFQQLEAIKGDEGIDQIVKISEAPFMELMSTMTNESSVDKIGEDIDDYLEHLETNSDKSVGIYTPFPIFNDIVGDGLRPGVHLVAARAKALRYGSKVYTPNGPVNIENIKIGDTVIHPFKGETKVLQTHDHSNKNLFRISFRDGDFVECCEDHLWEVKKRWGKKTLVMSTKEIIDHGFYKDSKCIFDIRLPNPTNFIEKEVEIKPYTLGVLLGDGSFCNKHTVVFASMDDDIVDFIKEEYGEKVKFDYKDENKKCTSYRINGMKSTIEKMGLWGKKSIEKWIPNNYKYNSIEVRLDILRGLMDTDGTCVFDKRSGNSRCQFSSSSERLANDVKEIVESLGGLCSVIKNNARLNNKTFVSYKCEIRLPLFNPFKMKRKSDKVRPRLLGELKRSIRNIEPVGVDNARCLTLEENDGLFMTNNFIVTHNTGKMQPYDSLIYTPNGPKKMGEIETGDIVLTPFNETAFVTDIFEHGLQDVYKVLFIDGTSMECGLDHIFEYTTRKSKYFRNKTLRELLEHPIIGPDRHYLYRVRISKPIQFNETQQVIDPYIMGVILSDREAFENFNKKDMLLFYDIEKWKDRRVPHEYLYGTLKSREALYKGMMDGSGVISKKIKEYASDSVEVCKDLCELIRTMGGVAENFTYRVEIRFDVVTKSFVSVEKLDTQKVSRCIKIDKKHGLYLTDDLIVTHNSTVGKEVSVYTAKQGVPTLYLDTEMQSSDQINRILASMTKINIRRIEKGLYKDNPYELKRVRQAAAEVKNMPLFHKNVSGKDFAYILSILKRWIHKEVGFNGDKPNPHMVVYDYFKLMDPKSLKDAQEYQLMGFQIAAMHDFCMQNNTPVLSFVQTNRDGITKDSADVVSQSDRLVWNCFMRNQDFITSNGVKSFNDFNDGDETIVLSHDGSWQKAVVRNYGNSKFNTYYLGKTNQFFKIKATKNHRWLLKGGKETCNLKVGDEIAKQENVFDFDYDLATIDEQLYWCYGFVYGDGEANKRGYSMVRLCGKDSRFESRFTSLGFKSSSSLSLKGDIICYTGKYSKTAPDPEIDSPNLIKAFCAGYLQADGAKNHNKTGKKYLYIQASDADHINFIRKCFPVAGVFIISETDLTGQETNFGVRPYTIKFTINDQPNGSSTKVTRVVKVEEETDEGEAWCLEVENTKSFVLPNGTPTGNCISLSILRRKTSDEIAVDGIQNGNAKLIPLAGRYMKMLDDGDYLNFNINGDIANIKEISTRRNPKTDTGFEIDNSSKQDIESGNGSDPDKIGDIEL